MEFENLGSLAAHFSEVAESFGGVPGVGEPGGGEARHTLERIGSHLEEKAREKIGNADQYEQGWPELAEATEADKARHGYPTDAPLLRTGELRDSIGHTVELDELAVTVGSTDQNMVYHEFGTATIPPRPVFQTLAQENDRFIQHEAAKLIIRAFKKARGGRK